MDILLDLIQRYPELDFCKRDILTATEIIISCYEKGGKVLLAGNGGSAADADHIVGELMKGFVKKRPINSHMAAKLQEVGGDIGKEIATTLQGALPAINLSTHSALHTAFANDVDYSFIYAQLLLGYAKQEDVFIGISTSGNSANIIKAAIAAKACGIKTVGLTGKTGGKMNSIMDVVIKAPSTETYKIQEYHLPIYHALCLMVEEHFYKL